MSADTRPFLKIPGRGGLRRHNLLTVWLAGQWGISKDRWVAVVAKSGERRLGIGWFRVEWVAAPLPDGLAPIAGYTIRFRRTPPPSLTRASTEGYFSFFYPSEGPLEHETYKDHLTHFERLDLISFTPCLRLLLRDFKLRSIRSMRSGLSAPLSSVPVSLE
jgi:hypothetical protein